ncbi:MAG: hypothetical protein OWR62_15805 [Sulfobacillus thermotolerans]|nr:hypothetical protein [Sulfobacillus thermotolerans]
MTTIKALPHFQCQALSKFPGWPSLEESPYAWAFGEPAQKRLSEIQGFITAPNYPLTRDRLEAMTSLIVVSTYGTGYDYIDVASASDLGILVTHTPEAVVAATAELGLTLIMALMRHIVPHDQAMREVLTDESPNPGFLNQDLTHNANSQIVGLVGYGRVAQRLEEILRAVGFQVIYTRKHGSLEGHPGYHTLSELLSQADFVVVLTPLTHETYHLIGERELNCMKPTAYLVNISRGPCVDESALVRFLTDRRIQGAALDVFEHEPHVSSELRQLSSVILSPHTGTQTLEARFEMTRDAVANVEKGLLGIAQNGVNTERWTRRP